MSFQLCSDLNSEKDSVENLQLEKWVDDGIDQWVQYLFIQAFANLNIENHSYI